MNTNRTIYHGNWGITFLKDGNRVGTFYFPVGPQGPVDPSYNEVRTMRNCWLFNGELPDDVVLHETLEINNG